jgi:predicted regulator of Ras-like GTPase activity (Roadblock/LC7/MglB family)
MDALAELLALRRRLPDVAGTVLAAVDGMLIASDLRDGGSAVEAETVAAMCATTLGLGQRFAATVGQGGLMEVVMRAAGGYIATYAAGGGALLTVLAHPHANVARLHLEARRSAERIGRLLDVYAAAPPRPNSASTRHGGPLATRTPMATLNQRA